MITDDARLTDAGACQMETWVHIHQDEREFWALPACNPGGNFELTLGGALAYTDGQKQHGALLVQGKTLIKPLTTNSYGIGFAAGYATQPGSEQSGSPYLYVPVSFSLADDRVVIHTNLGNLRERESRKNHLTWGVGGDEAGHTLGQTRVGGRHAAAGAEPFGGRNRGTDLGRGDEQNHVGLGEHTPDRRTGA